MTKDEILQELWDISEEIEEFSDVLYNDKYIRKSRKSSGLVLLSHRVHEIRKQIGKVEEPDGYDEYGRAIKYVDDGRGDDDGFPQRVLSKEKEKVWETIESKKKIPMFSAYRNNEEYAEAFKDVSDSMKRGTQ